MAKNPKNQKSWEKRFDKRFNKEVVVMGDYLFEDIKSFIRQLLQAERKRIVEEMEMILKMEVKTLDPLLLKNWSDEAKAERRGKVVGYNQAVQEHDQKVGAFKSLEEEKE